MNTVLTVAALFAAFADESLRIESTNDGAAIKVIARLPNELLDRVPLGKLAQDDGEKWLRLALVRDDGSLGEPILGSYERSNDLLAFAPRFNLEAGKTYRASFIVNDKSPSASKDYQVSSKKFGKAAAIDAIYPSGDVVPANLLKFYVHFSKPMRESKDIFEHFRLLDADGNLVEDPWRRTELWNADCTRLTLWIHPGRIKQGVNLREEIGPVLEPNRRYSLAIGDKLLDADGQPLGREFKKSFRTTDALRAALALCDWKLTAPASDRALEVTFPQPLDRALLDRMLSVRDAEGKSIAGRIDVSDTECRWSFRPERPWQAGDYSLRVDEQLEDLAGNTLLRPFDFDRKLPELKDPPRSIPFRVK